MRGVTEPSAAQLERRTAGIRQKELSARSVHDSERGAAGTMPVVGW